MDVFDFELQHRVPDNITAGQGSILQSIGTFITHNIHDILEDFEVAAAEHPAPQRSSSCPRGRRPEPSHKPSQQHQQHHAPQQPASPWRWDSPPRTERRQASFSLTASPESPAARRNVLLDVVSNLGQQATAFLDRLDQNFEHIFKAEDHAAVADLPVTAAPQLEGTAGTAGVRKFALAGKHAGGAKGGKLGATKGKLGANRLSGAAAQPAAASAASGPIRTSPTRIHLARSKPGAETKGPQQDKAAAATPAPVEVLPLFIGGDAEVTITPMASFPDPSTGKADQSQPRAESRPDSSPRKPSAVQPAELTIPSPAASSLSHSSCQDLAGGEEQQRTASGTPSSTSSSVPAAGAGPRVLTAADKKRCLKALWQEVTTLKAERQVLESQVQELGGLRQEKQELQAQVEHLARLNNQLIEENSRLQLEGQSHAPDPLSEEAVRQQMSALLLDKAKLAEENQRLARENEGLHALLALTTEHSQLVDSASEWPSPSSCLPLPPSELEGAFDTEYELAPAHNCAWRHVGNSGFGATPTPSRQQSTHDELLLLRQQYDELLGSGMPLWDGPDLTMTAPPVVGADC